MLNLKHIDDTVDHQDQVVPFVAACISDSSFKNLCLSRRSHGIKAINYNYWRCTWITRACQPITQVSMYETNSTFNTLFWLWVLPTMWDKITVLMLHKNWCVSKPELDWQASYNASVPLGRVPLKISCPKPTNSPSCQRLWHPLCAPDWWDPG